MGAIRRISFLTFKFLIYGAVTLCAVGFAREKYYAHTLPQHKVEKRCDGHRTLESVCDCYNYYGRQCLSEKRLLWDWTPEDEETMPTSPKKLDPLTEDEELNDV